VCEPKIGWERICVPALAVTFYKGTEVRCRDARHTGRPEHSAYGEKLLYLPAVEVLEHMGAAHDVGQTIRKRKPPRIQTIPASRARRARRRRS
jgi:hypothetical protein